MSAWCPVEPEGAARSQRESSSEHSPGGAQTARQMGIPAVVQKQQNRFHAKVKHIDMYNEYLVTIINLS